MMLRKLLAGAIVFFSAGFLAFSEDADRTFGETITSLESHRFVEVRGAIPSMLFTSHGAVQSFVVAFGDVFGEIFTGNDDFDNTTPKLATDINITFFPPIADYRLGFMFGVAIDTWNSKVKKDDVKVTEELSMNYYYVGFHVDYGHWVMSSIGTRISIYGELSAGWLAYDDYDDSDRAFCFDVCPIGIQFCPEKHIGIYFEFPHLGARPFVQTGVSIGL